MKNLQLSFALIAWLLGFFQTSQAIAETVVVVVTPFPNSFYEPFRRAFEAREPGHRLRFVNRKTTTAVTIIGDRQIAGADLFWASSPDAFAVLKNNGDLEKTSGFPLPGRAMVGRFPVDDPDGFFKAFTVSGYGMIWNSELLTGRGLEPPKAIAELLEPRYRGLVAMSTPSRSGTTHLMVETVLQRYGWQKGWEIWLGVAGNLATVTARSFSVSSGVVQGRFAIGLSIDFLGRDRGSMRIGFGSPSENVILPGSIGLLKGGTQPAGAKKFMAFILGPEGQALLADPKIGRFPVSPANGVWPIPDLFAEAERDQSDFVFDAGLSGRRYELVNILFDELITERLARIQTFWRQHGGLERYVARHPDLAAEYNTAARLARSLPPDLAALNGEPQAVELRRISRGMPMPPAQLALIEQIRSSVERQMSSAEAALERVVKQVRNRADGTQEILP